MVDSLRADALQIVREAIAANLPDRAVEQALQGRDFPGRVVLVAAGKAAWRMAQAACRCTESIGGGIVITKYGHVMGDLPGIICCEAGHPVPDEASFRATEQAVRLVQGLTAEDTVLFLLSGGGSSLFELPLLPAGELQDVTRQLLGCGADITEINTIRKRLSAVKGGRFAALCAPARVYSVVLSDVLGDRADMIASGPTCADATTCAQAQEIAARYALRLSPRAQALLGQETPRQLPHADLVVTGSVKHLCEAARAACEARGYAARIVTAHLTCQAREAGAALAALAATHAGTDRPLAFVMGGETVVTLTGDGKGGRCQELALAAAQGLESIPNAAVVAVGSDGTDGPTDAAGGYADAGTAARLRAAGLTIPGVLARNDAYHALRHTDGLVFTGPTGTNVNDVAVLLIHPARRPSSP